MRRLLIFIISFTIWISSCVSSHPTPGATHTPDGTFIMPSPYPTLSMEIQNQLYAQLQMNGGCEFPCFLGVVPGETPLTQALSFFQIYSYNQKMSNYQVGFPSAEQWHDSTFYTNQGDRKLSFRLSLSSLESVVTGMIVNFEAPMKPDRKGDSKSRLLERYGVVELFKRHGIPSEIYLYPTRIRQTQSAYAIEVVYLEDKIMASYSGIAKLAENGKYELCPAIGDGNVDSFSMAFADPSDPDVNIIKFMWGSFNENFDLARYAEGLKRLDPRKIYDLFINQGKRCFYEDEYWIE